MFEYFKLFQKMSLNWREGKETSIIGLLDPFRKLEYLPPSAAKRIIHGSAQMFIESDEDKDNLLSQVIKILPTYKIFFQSIYETHIFCRMNLQLA